ncbi:hypothetical protein HanPSC8_Chr15g0657451 [Helianthus annuus]|nr:hypothetical protein HanPSC8_Chr15g0657451 [Helianthus annuus]
MQSTRVSLDFQQTDYDSNQLWRTRGGETIHSANRICYSIISDTEAKGLMTSGEVLIHTCLHFVFKTEK